MEFETILWGLNGLILFGEIIAVMIAFIHFRKQEKRDKKLEAYKIEMKEYVDKEIKKAREVYIIDNKKE